MSVRPAECRAGTTPRDARVVALRIAVGRPGAAEQGRHRVGGGLAGRARGVDQVLVGFNLVPGQGIAVAAQAGARGGDGGRVADVGDAPVAVGDEMSYGAERRAVVVDLDQVGRQAGRGPVDEYDRNARDSRDSRVEPGMVVPGRAEQQPGHPALHHPRDDVALPGGVPAGAGDQHGPAVPRHLQLHRVDDLGEERIGDGLHHEPDRGVRARPQGPGHRVGLEPQVEHCRLDALPGDRRDPRVVVQDPRSGAQAHPGRVRDVQKPGWPADRVLLGRALLRKGAARTGCCAIDGIRSLCPDFAIDGKPGGGSTCLVCPSPDRPRSPDPPR